MPKELVLWYSTPAKDDEWESKSLPIGNSYMGASIFGGAIYENKHREKLTLTEKTFWTGGPSELRPDYRGGNRNEQSYKSTKAVQEALANGEKDKVKELLSALTGGGDGYGAFQTLGNMYFTFDGIDETVDYKRKLNLANGSASVCFKNGGEYHRREYFASHPSAIIASKFITEGGTHSFSVSMDNAPEGAEFLNTEGEFAMFGKLADNGLEYYMTVKLHTDGELTINPVGVKNATKTIIYICAATDYANVYPNYRSGKRPSDIVYDRISAAEETRYGAVWLEHQADFVRLIDRASIDLGAEIIEIPTDVLLEKYKSDEADKNEKLLLEEMYFNYGRYLLISSSRGDTLPANLQGVWNNTNTPPWSSDYHINVNLQMNYWPAYVTNLAQTAIPLIDYMESLRAPGRVTAAEYFNIVSDEENPENGWIAHTQSTPFGWTCPGWDFYWGWSCAAVAWLCQNIWEYYEFTGDKELLGEKIYPIMRESARFYLQWLIYDQKQDRMVSSPSYSPEHGPVTIGNTYEQSLIQQFLSDFIEASKVLELDEELREKAEEIKPKLNPYHVGIRGQLKEWFEEDTDGFDTSEIQPNHRHISHLLGLYPGKAISQSTPELLRAAVVTLNERGDESTGWARAYKLNLWARTGDGNRAYKLLNGLISGSTFPNLWDVHPPFQIDGNFGGTAGIAEMLIQSHEGYIHILPSLPFAWKGHGSFSGLCARGGFEVSCEWSDGEIERIEILSKNGGICRVKTGDDILEFETEAGKSYSL